MILDIKLAESKIPDSIKNRTIDNAGGIEEALAEAEFKPLEDWIGLSKEVFPPFDRINSNQAKHIVEHLIPLLKGYGYTVNIPKNVRTSALYRVLIAHLSQETPLLPNHHWQLALCGYDTKSCPFGSRYCQCKDWESLLLEIPEIEEEKGMTFVNGEVNRKM